MQNSQFLLSFSHISWKCLPVLLDISCSGEERGGSPKSQQKALLPNSPPLRTPSADFSRARWLAETRGHVTWLAFESVLVCVRKLTKFKRWCEDLSAFWAALGVFVGFWGSTCPLVVLQQEANSLLSWINQRVLYYRTPLQLKMLNKLQLHWLGLLGHFHADSLRVWLHLNCTGRELKLEQGEFRYL